MKMFCTAVILASTFFISGFLAQPRQHEETPAGRTAGPFMRAKLVASQDVLNGLVTENFDLIRRGAADMKRMSQAVQWPIADDKVYQHMGVEFRRQCDKLVQLADAGNLQGAHYTWLHITTTCIDCHNYVRSAFRVEQNQDPQGPIRLIPTDWEGRTYQRDRSGDNSDK